MKLEKFPSDSSPSSEVLSRAQVGGNFFFFLFFDKEFKEERHL